MSRTTLDLPTAASAPDRRHALIGVGMLIFCCLLWGYSFPVMQVSAGAFEHHTLAPGGPVLERVGARGAFNGVRFLLAAAVYAAVVLIGPSRAAATRVRWGRPELVGGLVVGTFFAGGMLLQVTGLCWALPSVSAFLTSLAVVFAPIGQAAVLRRRVGGAVWIAVVIALAGVVLLSWPKGGDEVGPNALAGTPPIPLLGELLTVAAAVLFTAQILAVEWFGSSTSPAPATARRPADPAGLTVVMLLTTGLLSLAAGLALSGPTLRSPPAWRGLATDATYWWSIATLVVFSSVMALSLMNRYQPRVPAAVAAVVYCTEPVFGTLFSLAFGTERLTLVTVLGGLMVLGAVAVVGVAGSTRPDARPPA